MKTMQVSLESSLDGQKPLPPLLMGGVNLEYDYQHRQGKAVKINRQDLKL